MRYELYIALRYLFSRKKHNTINLITWVSMVGVAVSVVALICVLSVLNGFENVVEKSFSAFDPELKIVPASGKFFSSEDSVISKCREEASVAVWSEVVEQDGLVAFKDQQTPVIVKGVDDSYINVADFSSLLWDGNMDFHNSYAGNIPAAMGIGIAQRLASCVDPLSPLRLYSPKGGHININRPDVNFNETPFVCSAIFSVQQVRYDENLIIMPIGSVRKAYNMDDCSISSVEIRVSDNWVSSDEGKIQRAQKKLQNILGADFLVLNRHEQQADFYRISRIEKWTTFMILSFILLIATFNIIGSLSMIIIEKRDDISLFRSLGSGYTQIRRIFLIEGFSISAIGALIGTVLGVIIVLVQQYFGILKLGSGFITQVYPVELQLFDVFCVISVVLVMGYLAALYTSRSQFKTLR